MSKREIVLRLRLRELSQEFDCGEEGALSVAELHELAILQAEHLDAQAAEIEKLRRWVNDLQSGMYVNCVYCGHRYGPQEDTPVAMADVLKEHIAQCPEHPLSAANAEIERLRGLLQRCYDCGHRNGWEDGETTNEVMEDVGAYIYELEHPGAAQRKEESDE